MKVFTMNSYSIPSEKHRFFQVAPADSGTYIRAVVPGYAQLPASLVSEDILLIQDKLPLNPTRRLVVLVPTGEFNQTAVARHIWQLAAGSGSSVLYLMLSMDDTQAAHQRRRLADLAASTTGENVHAHASLCAQTSWRQALEKTLQPGDLLVCLASHHVSDHLIRRRKLGEQMVESVGVPVYLIGGIKIGMAPETRQAIKEALAWIASLCLIAAFFAVQASIDRATDGLLTTILIIMAILAEMYLLLKINEWI